MAFEIKKSGAIHNSIDEVESHDERMIVARDRMFADNEAATIDSIMAIYDTNSDKLANGTDDQQIMLISTLHAQREFMGWFLGEALMMIDEAISSGKKEAYNSLNDWINQNEDRLGFSKRTAYSYIQIRETATLDQFQKLGVKKTLLVAQIRDEKKRDAVIKTVSAGKVTVEETKKKVDDIILGERRKAQKIVEAKKEEAFDEVKYTLVKASATDILFRTDRKYLEAAQNVLLAEGSRLKIKILDEYKRLTGRK